MIKILKNDIATILLHFLDTDRDEIHQEAIDAIRQVLVLRPRKPNFTEDFKNEVLNYSAEVFGAPSVPDGILKVNNIFKNSHYNFWK